jgi:purine nucleoside permease
VAGIDCAKEQGAGVTLGVRKHLNDAALALLALTTRIPLDKKIGDDMARFLAAVGADTTIDPKALQLGNVAVAELVTRIAKAYEIELRQS